ncbi:MAG: hypothetical protein P8L71_04645 [Flavobacteriales bacterium]|nr:hypothetical protein [Flavobacteriales bacterium]
MKQSRNVFMTVILASLALAGCLDPIQYPDEPVISFISLETGQTGTLTIGFTDGDGNIGLAQGDTLAPFCPDTCEFYYNLFLEYYELQNGEWTHIPLDPELGQVPFYYRVPEVTPTGQNQSLNGEIEIDMPAYFLITDFDTCRFEIKLVDRSFNESNIELTNSFVKP